MRKSQRSVTPLAFAEWLVEIARRADAALCEKRGQTTIGML